MADGRQIASRKIAISQPQNHLSILMKLGTRLQIWNSMTAR